MPCCAPCPPPPAGKMVCGHSSVQTLVRVIVKALVHDGGGVIPSAEYRAFVEKVCEASADSAWEKIAEGTAAAQVVSMLDTVVRNEKSLPQDELLQIRTITAFLAVSPSSTPLGDVKLDSVRVGVHYLLALDAAADEGFIPLNLQGSRIKGENSLLDLLSRYVSTVADSFSPLQVRSILTPVICRLKSEEHRVKAFAEMLSCVRKHSVERCVPSTDIEEDEAAALVAIQAAERNLHTDSGVVNGVLARLSDPASGPVALLTHSAESESILWLSMTDDASQLPAVLHKALDLLPKLWDSNEIEGLGDVVDILAKRVIPRVKFTAAQSVSNGCAVPFVDSERFSFWLAVANCLRFAVDHARCVNSMTGPGQQRTATKAETLRVEEERRRYELFQNTWAALQLCTRLSPAAAASPTAGAVISYVEAVALAMAVVPAESALLCLQGVMTLIGRLQSVGLIREALPQKDAASLFVAVRTARAAYNQRIHDDCVAAARQGRHLEQVGVPSQQSPPITAALQ